jgi:hypothetical protein
MQAPLDGKINQKRKNEPMKHKNCYLVFFTRGGSCLVVNQLMGVTLSGQDPANSSL